MLQHKILIMQALGPLFAPWKSMITYSAQIWAFEAEKCALQLLLVYLRLDLCFIIYSSIVNNRSKEHTE